MGYGRCVGREGALAVATRMTVSIGVAAMVVMATVLPAPVSPASPTVKLSADRTALVMCGTTCPTPNAVIIGAVRDQAVAPTHPGEVIEYIPVTTPEEFWPISGVFRVLAVVLGEVDPNMPPGMVAGTLPEGYSLLRLSGLFDRTIDQSAADGVTSLESEMAKHPGQPLVIYGISQSAAVANMEKIRLAEQYPKGTDAPDIDFVLQGDPWLPNGGISTRFPGLYIPILDMSFGGQAPTDTQFDTVEINRQYDGFADFPLYPLNVVADLNAVAGVVFVHLYSFEVSLPEENPTESPAYQGHYGDTDYYFFETQDLPLFEPLRIAGVPEPVIDTFEPVVRWVVELGYDRSIKPWEPTPARLIPTLDPAKVTADLVNAIGEGITNAAALIGAPAPLSGPAPAVTADHGAALQRDVSTPAPMLQRVSGDVGDGVSRVLSAVGSALPKPRAVTRDDLAAPRRTIAREPATTRDGLTAAIGTVKSVIGDGRTIVRSTRGDNGSPATTARPARKTPVRDALNNASTDITKSVTKVSDSMKQARGGTDDSDRSGGAGAAR